MTTLPRSQNATKIGVRMDALERATTFDCDLGAGGSYGEAACVGADHPGGGTNRSSQPAANCARGATSPTRDNRAADRRLFLPERDNIWIPIDAYLVRHYGWQTADRTGCMASIACYSQQTLVGYVNFYNADHVPQSAINVFTPPQPVLTINYPVERVQEVIETLRLEAVVHIGVDLSQRIGWLGIDPAAVGHVAK